MEAKVTFSDGRTATVKGETREDIVSAVEEYEASIAAPPQQAPEGQNLVDMAAGLDWDEGMRGLKAGAELGLGGFYNTAVESASGLAGLEQGMTQRSGVAGGQATRDFKDRFGYEFSPDAQELAGSLREYAEPVASDIEKGLKHTSRFFQERGADLLSPFGEKGKATGSALGAAVIPAAGIALGSRNAPSLPKRKVDPRAEKLRSNTGDTDTAGIKLEGDKVVKDAAAKEAMRQGAEEGVVASIKAADPKSKANMNRMLDVLEKGQSNARYAVLNRPAQVMGDSIAARIRHVRKVNEQAARQLDFEARKLKGQPVDHAPVVESFLGDLDGMGVRMNPRTGKLEFQDSDIEKLKGPQKILKNVVERMLNTRTPDGYDVHRLKKYIDENVTYGKSKNGLTGKAETIVKRLRSNLDGLLDQQFPGYNQVNTQFSETITALQNFQRSTRVDFDSPNVNKALGNEMRKLLSNYRSRTNLLDSLDEMSEIAGRYGGQFTDDIIVQAMFVKELDNMFGAVAKGSFKGEIESGIKTALTEGPGAAARNAALEGVAKKLNEMRGVNPQAAIKALRELLSEQPQASTRGAGLPAVRQ